MKFSTKPQIQKIHILIKQTDFTKNKAEIVLSFTDGRTDSTKEMYFDEARALIKRLSEYSPNERMKSLIFSLAYRSGMIYGTSADDKKMNEAKINAFLLERGTVKKMLHQMDYFELTKVHRQFEGIVANTAKSKANKEAKESVKLLLNELDMEVR